jgi:hypothetical protein
MRIFGRSENMQFLRAVVSRIGADVMAKVFASGRLSNF